MNDKECNTNCGLNCDCGAGEDLPVFASQAESDKRLALMAKALGHPARVQILRILAQRTSCVCGDIVSEMSLSQSTVSEHLRILKEAGWIVGEVNHPRVCYCLNPRSWDLFRGLTGSF